MLIVLTMSIFFNYNGKLFEDGTPVIGADSRGLRYGDGIFETMKMQKGKLLFAKEHFFRLNKGMSILQFTIPPHFSPKLIEKEIYLLVKKNNHIENVRVRLTIVRGDGGINDAENNFPNYIIQTWQLSENIGELNSNGLILGIYNDLKSLTGTS